LVRMTGIVIATVIIFAALVGGADYLLSLGVKQAVATQAASAHGHPGADHRRAGNRRTNRRTDCGSNRVAVAVVGE